MIDRRNFLAAIGAVALVGVGTEAEAKRRRASRRRARGASASGLRGTSDDGRCRCNGGKVCVGPRGGRYCITSSGRKRYGV